ncbi:hypothetical protein [Nocardia abscessus]|uniref:hypothetical protein n=1 Tax=Nocardia abscessus TaxID=120957 RepID=UPI0024581F40|nr:hypothetical protein [Nocardia abscessus]
MRDPVIRMAGNEDLLAVLIIHDQLASDGAPIRVLYRQRQTRVRMLRSDKMTVYLAEVDGKPVRTVTQLLIPHVTYDCAPTAFIEAVVVDLL